MTGELLVRQAEVGGRGPLVDVRVHDAVVVEVRVRLAASEGAAVVHARGGALIPGLHDHHIHLMATAVDATSVRVGPPEVSDLDGLARALTDADRRLPAGEWIRATAYHESVAGDLERSLLDRLVPQRPLRVQDRTGARWTLNRAAIDALRLDDHAGPEVERDGSGRPTGRIHRGDDLLRSRLEPAAPDLGPLGAHLAARGVTAVTDTTPYRALSDLTPLSEAVRSGALPQRVVVTGGPELAAAGEVPGLGWGPVKLVIDDAHYPSLDDVADGIATAHRHARTVAIHCVSRTALALAVAAWDVAGAVVGDRVEHGSVIPPDLAEQLARLGLTVVTQPGFVYERGDDYLRDVDPEDVPHLYRCGSLLAAGIPVLASTDAPYTRPDPWPAIAAAARRRTRSGAVLGRAERIAAREALRLFGADPRAVALGRTADLCLLTAPLDQALHGLPDVEIACTIRAGSVIWDLRG